MRVRFGNRGPQPIELGLFAPETSSPTPALARVPAYAWAYCNGRRVFTTRGDYRLPNPVLIAPGESFDWVVPIDGEPLPHHGLLQVTVSVHLPAAMEPTHPERHDRMETLTELK